MLGCACTALHPTNNHDNAPRCYKCISVGDGPFVCHAQVAALEARELDAVWDTAGQPCIRLGEELPTLVVRAKDASGKV